MQGRAAARPCIVIIEPAEILAHERWDVPATPGCLSPGIRGEDRYPEDKESNHDGGEVRVNQDEQATQDGDNTCREEPARPILLGPELVHQRMDAILPAVIIILIDAAGEVYVIVDEVL